jgi:hypothetical protein
VSDEGGSPEPLTTPAEKDVCYFLFSSNQRPQYEQDIVDVVGSPKGAPYRFRYVDTYIEGRLKNDHPPAGSRVLVVYSIQQKARYHEPAYIPVRFGTVTSVERYGDFLALDFILGDTCCVPIGYEGSSREARNNSKREAVIAFTSFIHDQEGEKDPSTRKRLIRKSPREGMSLSFGVLPAGVVNQGDDSKIFQNLAELLQDTASFAATRFLRFERMTERSTAETVASEKSGHTVEPGKVYDLWFQQWQPREILKVEKFKVSVDGQNIKLIGSEVIEIASMYDMISVPVVATTSTTMERRYSLIAVDPVDPTPGVSGPRIKIPVIITVPTSRKAFVAGASAAGAVLLGLPALVGADFPTPVKLLFVGVSTIIFTLLSLYGFRR